jgi:hypothetical protein
MTFLSKNSKQAPTPLPEPQRPRVSDQWADAKAQVEALEDDLYKAQTYANEMVNRVKVAEAQLYDKRNELIDITNQRDYYQRRFLEVVEALKIGATIFYDAMTKAQKEDKPKEEPNVPTIPDTAQSAGSASV